MQLQPIGRFVICLTVLLVPAVGSAQQTEARTSALKAGTWSLQLPFPTNAGFGSIGIWKMRTDRTALGFVASINARRLSENNNAEVESTQSGFDLSLGPAWKWYRRLHPTVAAFGTTGVQAVYRRQTTDTAAQDQSYTTWGGAANAGIGAEWFPFSRISLGGTTGLSGSFLATDRDDELGTSGSMMSLNTHTTAIQVQIYF